MKIAITGATGFIGKLLIEKHLIAGDEVRILTRKKKVVEDFHTSVVVHIGDLCEQKSLMDFLKDIDVLYHCAAEINEEDKMYKINVIGTKNLIQAASGNVKHWVQLSSVGVYGPILTGVIDENCPYNPINEYERTKLDSDHLVLKELNALGITYTIIRPSNVFGASMRNSSVFELIRAVDKGYFLFIGKNGASANYVAVENVVQALYLGGTHPKAKNDVYIISSWITIEEFIMYISNALKKTVPLRRISKSMMLFFARLTSLIPKNPLTVHRVHALSNYARYSTDKIQIDLGYKPVISIEKSISNIVIQYLKH